MKWVGDRLDLQENLVKEFTMAPSKSVASSLRIDLGDELILRRSSQQDAEALADFNSRVHSDEGPDQPDHRIWEWTYDLLANPHPTFKASDFTIVEEEKSGKIISAMNLIPQTWTFGGIPFKVGRPELVGTLPEYRNRGLVRKQFDVIHRWSEENGDQLQAITGIPYYYRLFGYEMAMNLGGGRAGFPTHIPRLKTGESEPFHIRTASVADIPFLAQLYEAGCKRSLVACIWDEAAWTYELSGKSEKNVNRLIVKIIEKVDGPPCGYLAHAFFSWGDMMAVQKYEVIPEFGWAELTPSVIRYMEKVYEEIQPEHGEKQPFGAFGFWLGEDHPVYRVLHERLPRVRKPYAWYLRVPEVAGFLQLVSPVLEQRLVGSAMAGYSGELKLSFYRDGMRLVIDKGKLTTIEDWKPSPVGHAGEAGFPPHTFLQLLFGYRSMDMLKASFADCWTSRDEIHVLLDALFPHQPSDVWPIA
jgi:hypothetical protein